MVIVNDTVSLAFHTDKTQHLRQAGFCASVTCHSTISTEGDLWGPKDSRTELQEATLGRGRQNK